VKSKNVIGTRGAVALAGSALAALVLAACGGYGSSSSAPTTRAAETKPAPASSEARMAEGETGAIPQNNGGDQDADNNGGPSDGDGNV
jgi:hypothetical protein